MRVSRSAADEAHGAADRSPIPETALVETRLVSPILKYSRIYSGLELKPRTP